MFDKDQKSYEDELAKLKAALPSQIARFTSAPAIERGAAYLDLIGDINRMNAVMLHLDGIKVLSFARTL